MNNLFLEKPTRVKLHLEIFFSRQSQSVTSHSQNIEKIDVLIFEPCNFKKFKILFLYFFKNV
jgi:hypothetical protein